MPSPLKNKGTKDVKVFSPKKTAETAEIITYLKENPAIITLATTPKKERQRIVDVLGGASFALNMAICPLDKENFIIVKK
ncbi:MAG: cell division protein SepF [Clostridia bacterium]|nr:cell division protein SepF [Clostridia bacterium]